METFVRGFSYMPEANIEAMDLQYIESGELQRAWKTTRRQRARQQEQRIWEEFVKEQDILKTVYKDDPYQFLNQLPEECLQELLESELQKMEREKEEEDAKILDVQESEDESHEQKDTNQNMVTFEESAEKEDSEMFHIFYDDKEDDESGSDEEVYNESVGSSNTVRERGTAESSPASHQHIPDKVTSKSSENVTNMMQNTIYCARVKDLRIKITAELHSIMETLEQYNITSIELEDITKIQRRSTEFCSRFNRIYMYQLQRQIQDVKRNNAHTLPYAKHTQFQSQMVRIVSLHQNLLQSYQVFHKSLKQAGATSAASTTLIALIQITREIPPPIQLSPGQNPDLSAAQSLYDDEIVSTCDKLENVIKEYSSKMSDYINNTEGTNQSYRKNAKNSLPKRKSRGTCSKSGTKSASGTEARLSMYSLDTLRVNLKPKSSSSKDNTSSGASKIRVGLNNSPHKRQPKVQPTPANHTKSPRSRRPLMRDPQTGRAKRRIPRDTDIQTMVEAVGTCASSHISREPSPNLQTPRVTPRLKNDSTPRSIRSNRTTPKSQIGSPLNKLVQGAKFNNLQNSATNPKTVSSDFQRDTLDTKDNSQVQISPVSKINCSKKHENVVDDVKVMDSPRPSLGDNLLKTEKDEQDRNKTPTAVPTRCEVTSIVRQLCGGDAAGKRNEKITGAKNAQLVCISGGSPRQPSTPQLLRILEETIQKKAPKTLSQHPPSTEDTERFLLTFNIPEQTVERLFQYRTKFIQHMLTSPMYANNVIDKPWEVVERVSEQIIDDLLLKSATEMELKEIIQRLYNQEIR